MRGDSSFDSEPAALPYQLVGVLPYVQSEHLLNGVIDCRFIELSLNHFFELCVLTKY